MDYRTFFTCSLCFGCDILHTLLMDFLIWNSDWSWLIKFWSLKIKAQKQIPPKIQATLDRDIKEKKIFIHPLTPFNKNITWNLAERVDRFSLIRIFWHFEKCPSVHFKKCVMKFQKSKTEMYIFLFFHADHQGLWLFDPIQVYLMVNWPRKWALFDFWKEIKNISIFFWPHTFFFSVRANHFHP
jgi:hypothetical protein